METAIDIANALPYAKTGIMLNLFKELCRLFEKEKRAIYDFDEETITRYCFSRRRVLIWLRAIWNRRRIYLKNSTAMWFLLRRNSANIELHENGGGQT